jgi:hypothetical protein
MVTTFFGSFHAKPICRAGRGFYQNHHNREMIRGAVAVLSGDGCFFLSCGFSGIGLKKKGSKKLVAVHRHSKHIVMIEYTCCRQKFDSKKQ